MTNEQRKRAYDQFFSGVRRGCRARGLATPSAHSNSTGSAWGFSAGRPATTYTARFGPGGRFEVGVFIKGGRQADHDLFDRLQRDKATIEQLLGGELQWNGPPKKWRMILRGCPGSINWAPHELDTLTDWAVKRLARFEDVFRERLEVPTDRGTARGGRS